MSPATSTRSASITTILRTAWTFARKQTVLHEVTLWMLVIPSFLLTTIDHIMPGDPPNPYAAYVNVSKQLVPLLIIVLLLLIFISFWGYASVFFIGKRLIQNRVGRFRSSFSIVRRESLKLILPLFLTNILWFCTTAVLSLLFFVPGILILMILPASSSPENLFTWWPLPLLLTPLLIPALLYVVRSSFFDVVIVTGKERYREALRKSRTTIRGKTGRAIAFLIVTSALLFGPPIILSALFDQSSLALLPWLQLGMDFLFAILFSVAMVLYSLSSIVFFGSLRTSRVQHVEL